MGFLKRRREAQAAGPAWAPSFSPEETSAFLAEAGRALDAHGLQHTIDEIDGSASFVHGDIDGELSFNNLAARCADEPRSQWSEIVRAHFDTLMQSLDQPARELTYEEARSLLKVRLWDSEAVANPGLYRDVAEGLRAVVSLDLPATIEAITTGDIERWAIPEDELFAIALDNVRSDVEVELTEHDLGDGVTVGAARGDSFFSATHVLWPDGLGVGLGEHGAIVAVPTRHTVIVYPILDGQVHVAAGKLLALTGTLYDDGPGSLSPNIYWWYEGELMTQRAVQNDDGSLALGVGASFRELLNRLSP